jgi:hypothetical protein
MLHKHNYPEIIKQNPGIGKFIEDWNEIEKNAEEKRGRIIVTWLAMFLLGFVAFELILGAATNFDNFLIGTHGRPLSHEEVFLGIGFMAFLFVMGACAAWKALTLRRG